MCIAFALLDLALLFGVVALVIWILAITGIVTGLGYISHIFIVLAVIFFIVWLVFSCCYGAVATRRRGYFVDNGYYYNNRGVGGGVGRGGVGRGGVGGMGI